METLLSPFGRGVTSASNPVSGLTLNFAALLMPPPGVGLKTVTSNIPSAARSVSGITAINCVAETNVVTRAVPFQRTTDVGTKFVPVTVSINAGSPLKAAFGLRLVTVGAGLFTVTLSSGEVPPPGVGVKTVSFNVLPLATSEPSSVTFNSVAETNIVTRSAPLTRPIESGRKPVPVIVRIVAPAPAVMVGLSTLVGTGAGLLIGNVNSFDVPPAGVGLKTLIFAEPAFAMSAAEIAMVSCVPFTIVAARSTLLNFTTVPETKPVPFTVNKYAAAPAVAVAGFKLVNVGSGLPTVKLSSVEVPPPGVGVNTKSLCVAALAKSATDNVVFNCVAESKVVARSAPFTFTTELGRNAVPVNVTNVAALPTRVEFGLKLDNVGAGLLRGSVN